jgi:hypothetical protein
MLYSLPASVPALALGEMLYRPAPPPAAMAPFTTRLLASALSREADELRVRRAHARTLDDAGRLGSVLAPIEAVEGAVPGYLRFAGLTRGHGDGAPHLGVVRPYPQTLAEHHVTWELLACPSALPGACELRDRLVTLPTHSRVGETELALLTSWLAGTSSE